MQEQLEVLSTKLEGHIEDDDTKHKRQDAEYEKLMASIKETNLGIKDIVDAWKTIGQLQKFAKWLSGFAVLGVVVAWLLNLNLS